MLEASCIKSSASNLRPKADISILRLLAFTETHNAPRSAAVCNTKQGCSGDLLGLQTHAPVFALSMSVQCCLVLLQIWEVFYGLAAMVLVHPVCPGPI